MRILYIVTAFPRWPGDVITPWLTETIARLRARGVEVEVLAPAYRGLGDQLHDGARVHRFRYAPASLQTLTHDQTTPDRLRESPWYALLLPGYVIGGALKARGLANSGRFDAIHCFWPLPHAFLGLAARASSGVPVISTFFGVELTWVRRQLPFLSPLLRFVARRSDAVTVISSHTARQLRAILPDTMPRVIPFGAAARSDREAGLPEEPAKDGSRPFNLLFVGRLVERKGVGVLLEAVSRTRRSTDVRLTVVGDGPLRADLEAHAERLGLADAVTFAGFVSEDALDAHFTNCDAFVLPAIEDSKGDVEGLGVVVIEAMIHRRPVIASESGGIPDIVVREETGLLTEPGSVDSLAEAILRLRRDPALAERLTRSALDHVDRHFSWDHIIDELQSLYVDLARSSAHRRLAASGR